MLERLIPGVNNFKKLTPKQRQTIIILLISIILIIGLIIFRESFIKNNYTFMPKSEQQAKRNHENTNQINLEANRPKKYSDINLNLSESLSNTLNQSFIIAIKQGLLENFPLIKDYILDGNFIYQPLENGYMVSFYITSSLGRYKITLYQEFTQTIKIEDEKTIYYHLVK